MGAARRRNGSALEAPALVPPPEPKPTPELDVSTRKALVEAAAGKSSRQVIQMLAEMDPELAVPADRVRPLGGERWELKAVIDEECQRGLEQLKGLAVSRRSAHDAGAARRTPGAGGAQSPRSGPAARRARKSGSRPAGAERTSAPNSDGAATSAAQLETTHADAHSSTAKVQMGPAQGARSARQRPVQSAARGTSTPSAQGKVDDGATSVPTQAVERAGTAASALAPPLRRRTPTEIRTGKRLRRRRGRLGRLGQHYFGAEGGRAGRTRHSGGSRAGSLAAGRRTVPLRRSTHRTSLCVTASAAD